MATTKEQRKSAAKRKPAAKKSRGGRKSQKASPRSDIELSESTRVQRPSWQGTISFGLINVPVMLYAATRSQRISFHQLDSRDHSRVQQRRVSATTGEEVEYSDIVKGYELESGKYVAIEPAELDALDPGRSSAIELESFIDASQIDPIFREASYFALPGKNGEKSYALLRDAMAAEERAAVARLVMHRKEHIVALWPRGDVLVVSTLHFEDEVTDAGALPGGPPPESNAKGAELKAARQLVSALSTDKFEIGDYRDEYREAVIDLIEKKARGEAIVAPEAPPERAPATDLMAALEESLADVDDSDSAKRSGRGKGRRRRGGH